MNRREKWRTACACLVAGMSFRESAAYVGISVRSAAHIAGELCARTGLSLYTMREMAKNCPDEKSIGELIRTEIVAYRKWIEGRQAATTKGGAT